MDLDSSGGTIESALLLLPHGSRALTEAQHANASSAASRQALGKESSEGRLRAGGAGGVAPPIAPPSPSGRARRPRYIRAGATGGVSMGTRVVGRRGWTSRTQPGTPYSSSYGALSCLSPCLWSSTLSQYSDRMRQLVPLIPSVIIDSIIIQATATVRLSRPAPHGTVHLASRGRPSGHRLLGTRGWWWNGGAISCPESQRRSKDWRRTILKWHPTPEKKSLSISPMDLLSGCRGDGPARDVREWTWGQGVTRWWRAREASSGASGWGCLLGIVSSGCMIRREAAESLVVIPVSDGAGG